MNENTKEFYNIIEDLLKQPMVMQLKDYRQHYSTTRFTHCLRVAYYSYLICKKYNLDYKSAARAGMLHDLFLYDWRVKQEGAKGLHAFTHPKIAYENALKITKLNAKEKDIILKHMWPLTLKFPKYKESYIITLVDKYCTLAETVEHYKKNPKLLKTYKLACVLLAIMIITR